MMTKSTPGGMSEKTFQARVDHITLVMRDGLPKKVWWGHKEIAQRLAVGTAYVSQLTEEMAKRGLIVKTGTRPQRTKLLKEEVPVPSAPSSTTTYFGPIASSDAASAKELARVDNISCPTWFHRALVAYMEHREKVLARGW
jgi:hypothetical protein